MNLNEAAHVFGNIFVGDFLCTQYRHVLREKRIQTIINVSNAESSFITDDLKAEFNYFWLKTRDRGDVNLKALFQACLTIYGAHNSIYEAHSSIYEAHNLTRGSETNILLFCEEGASRSISCVCFLLMKSFGVNLKNALKLCVAARGAVVCPNDSFLRQLHCVEFDLFRKNSIEISESASKFRALYSTAASQAILKQIVTPKL